MRVADISHPAGRVFGAIVGGAIGFCIGPVTGSMLAAIAMGSSENPTTAEFGRYGGMAVGLIGGTLLGLYLGGHPIAARWSLGMGVAIGGVAFLAGFAGPILLTPDSPQGPLLGIFVTGPLGFLAGAVAGLAIGMNKQNRAPH
jgi:hypothetical protein